MTQTEHKEADNQNEQGLEDVFGQLEEVIDKMEGDVTLEESFRLYHKGMDMLKLCNDKIDKVEKQMLILDEEGETHEF